MDAMMAWINGEGKGYYNMAYPWKHWKSCAYVYELGSYVKHTPVIEFSSILPIFQIFGVLFGIFQRI